MNMTMELEYRPRNRLPWDISFGEGGRVSGPNAGVNTFKYTTTPFFQVFSFARFSMPITGRAYVLDFSNTRIVGSYPARGMDVRGCIQKFQDWVDNEIYAYNKKHSLRSNIKDYGDKTH